jgi:hypothetical protein
LTIDRDLRPRRYSEGVEHMPSLASSARVGTYADGQVLRPGSPAVARVGTYADGQVLRPEAPAVRRVGTYADTHAPNVEPAPMRPSLGIPRGRPRPRPA